MGCNARAFRLLLDHALTADERKEVSQSGLVGIEDEWVRNPHVDPYKPFLAPPDSRAIAVPGNDLRDCHGCVGDSDG